jgi:ubiquitin fusion degradation protein 1
MLTTLKANSSDIITISNKSLPLGKFVKIQPQSVSFLDITDPKAVYGVSIFMAINVLTKFSLENALRHFSTLTRGDIITIRYNQKLYDILVLEVKPGSEGISIVETDLEVIFVFGPVLWRTYLLIDAQGRLCCSIGI